ncbi:hypothetical protein ACFWY9_25315 [Amycolatopsis sp. NPDC059027]|uniref:hypothetical protein n=1 Tax=Amycolatopsis sp. NPDC059027 TaxID=3346709 RepID=UPI00366AF3DD
MTELFAEYRDISVTDPLRQGDVLEAVDPSASKWQRHLVVITADCDFAHDKHRGRVTCVPLLTAPDYLLEMQIPRIRERFMAKVVGALRKTLPADNGANISDERLRAWPCETDPSEIITALGLDGRDADTAKAALDSIRLISQPTGTLDEAVELVVASYLAAPSAPKRENVVRQITEALKGSYSHPPGDALFLSAVAPKHHLGYFVYLRHLEQVWQPAIATGPTRSAVSYRRISRLQDRYIHALVQRFALVFMSIGLPTEYEEIRDLHAEFLGETYK